MTKRKSWFNKYGNSNGRDKMSPFVFIIIVIYLFILLLIAILKQKWTKRLKVRIRKLVWTIRWKGIGSLIYSCSYWTSNLDCWDERALYNEVNSLKRPMENWETFGYENGCQNRYKNQVSSSIVHIQLECVALISSLYLYIYIYFSIIQ